MKLRSSVRLSLAALSIATLASCTASTELTNSWADPTAANRGFKKLVVVGVTPKMSAKLSDVCSMFTPQATLE